MDPIKDLYNAVKSKGIFVDEKDFRAQISKAPKDVYGVLQSTNLFVDYNDFETQLSLKKKEPALPVQPSSGWSSLPWNSWGASSQSPSKSPSQPVKSKSFEKIENFGADYGDFVNAYKENPKEFQSWAGAIFPNLTLESVKKEKAGSAPDMVEDAYLFRLYQNYDEKKKDAILNFSRTKRKELGGELNNTLSELSKITGKQYAAPKNEADFAAIMADLQPKVVPTTAVPGGLAGMGYIPQPTSESRSIEDYNKSLKSISGKVQESLFTAAGSYVFGELLKKNPNVTPIEIGREVIRIMNPELYKQYKAAGGDKKYGGWGGLNVKETPEKADAINRQMTQIGNQVMLMYGNKTAIGKALDQEKSLAYTLTYGEQEKVKNKIASNLYNRGIKPSSATQEQIDQVVSMLPKEEKGYWEQAVQNNNTTLPSSGFGYSLKNSYKNVVTDATKTVFGLLIPDKRRERALENMQAMATSDIVGENPQELSRFNQLEEKKKAGALTAEEEAEMKDLSTRVNIRPRAARIWDMIGSGTGQVLGLGTISAFTGGLSTAGTVGGSLRALAFPSGPGIAQAAYLMANEGNQREAIRLFPDSEWRQSVAAQLFNAVDMAVERIFPEEQVLSGSVKKSLAAQISRISQSQISSQLKDNLVKEAARMVIRAGKELGKAPVQEMTEETLGLFIKDAFIKPTLGNADGGLTMDKFLETGEQAFWGAALLGTPKGLMSLRNTRVPIETIWSTVSDPTENINIRMSISKMVKDGDMTKEDAQQKLALINAGTQEYANNPVVNGQVGRLSLKQRQNYFARLMHEKSLTDQMNATSDDNIKKTFQSQIDESKTAREKIFNNELEVNEDNKEVPVVSMQPVVVTANVSNIEDNASKKEQIKQKNEFITDDDFVEEAFTPEEDAADREALPESQFKTEEELSDFLANGQYAMLTGQNPEATPLSKEANRKLNEKAQQWLSSRGLTAIPIFGKYGNSERSFMVPNMTKQQAAEFAKEFQQESVAHSSGLVYQDGSFNPRTEGVDIIPRFDQGGDFFSTINVGGKKVDFSINYDFDQKVQPVKSVADRLRTSIFGDNKAKVASAQKSLEKTGVVINMIEDPNEYEARVAQFGGQRGTEGIFVSDAGQIFINQSKLDQGIADGRVIWHEASHPVVNIIRNTNPELFNKVVSGLRQAAETNQGVADALAWANDNYSSEGEGVVNDEAVVETIAGIADGVIDIQSLPTGLKQSIIDFINTIAKALGLGQVLNDTDVAAFKKLANDVSSALREGRDISGIVGADNVTKTSADALQRRANEVFDGILNKIGITVGTENKNTGKVKVTNFDVAKAMNKYYTKMFKKLRIDDFSNKAIEIVSEHAADEVIFGIQKFGNNSGKGWYTVDYNKALDIMKAFDPDIVNNPDIREVATAVIAIASNSTDVYTNLSRVVYAVDQFKKTGKVPTDIGVGKGMSAIATSVEVYNNLLDLFGNVQELKEFMSTIRPVSESKQALIEKAGVKSWAKVKELGLGTDSEWNEDEVLPTSVILFGPKIGAFWSNLSGLSGTPTIDRWCIRTMYRYRGDMMAKALPSEIDAFVKANGLEEQSKGNVLSVIQNHAKLFTAILTGKGEYAGQSKAERNERLKPYRKGSQIWGKMSGVVNEIEDGLTEKIANKAQYARDFRTFTKQTFERVQEKVKERIGEDLTISDIQAILWIYEKELFGALGVKQRPESTYSASAQRLLNEMNSGSFTLDQLKSGNVKSDAKNTVDEEGSMGDSYGMSTDSFESGVSDQPNRLNGDAKTVVQASKGNRLAPNGKPSNLNDQQYDQVRTPQFKNWFGDWENDPANASKVVDENGEPLVVYHGTSRDFDVFAGEMQFFSTDKNFSKEYGDRIIEAFIDIRKPFDATDPNDFSNLIDKVGEVVDPYDDASYKSFSDYVNSGSASDSWWVVENYYQEIQSLGYDGGLIYEGGSTLNYFTVSPNQIKSATDNSGEFSTTDNRIQASKGNRLESSKDFKLAAFVIREKADGAPLSEIVSGIASVFPNMTPQEIKDLVDDPETWLRSKFSYLSKALQDNLISRAANQNIRAPRSTSVDPSFAGLEVPMSKIEGSNKKPTIAQRIDKAVTNFKNNWIDPAKGLPDWVMSIKDFASGARQLEISRAVKAVEQLKAVAKEIGFTDWDAFSEAIKSLSNPSTPMSNVVAMQQWYANVAAAGKQLSNPPANIPAAVAALPSEIIPFVYQMRGQIDRLTGDLIASGYVTPEQAVVLEKNLGAYVNRAYKMYNERGWKPAQEQMNEAIKFLADNYIKQMATENPTLSIDDVTDMAIEQAKKDVQSILDKKRNPFFGKTSVESRDMGILKERQEIPEPIRKLMGEYTDPGTVFVMTVAKQAALKASSEYLTKLRQMGMGSLFFEASDSKRPIEASVKIASDGSDTLSPLNGLYTTPEVAEALQTVTPTYNAVTNAWMKAVGAVRWGKTVGSIKTQILNFESNLGFAVMNGLLLSGSNKDAFRAAGKYVKGQYSKSEIDEITEKVISLGLVNQGVSATELKEMLGSGDVHDIALDLAVNPDSKYRMVKKAPGKALDVFNKLYRMGDDFWKVYAYMNERALVSKAMFGSNYDSLTDEQKSDVDIEASERVKNTWPTYDRVFSVVKNLSKNVPILGNFVSFRAESIRVLSNTVKMAIKDLKSDDPGFREMGAKRMAGIVSYVGLRSAITYAAAHAAGVAASGMYEFLFGDDEEKRKKDALKKAAPPFMAAGDVAVNQHNDEPWKFTIVDLSSIDPYNVVFKTWNAFTEGREGMKPGPTAAFTEFFGGFLDTEMTFETLMDAVNNRDSKTGDKIVGETDEGWEAYKKVGAFIVDRLQPSTIGMVERMTGKNAEAEALSLLGMRPYEVDLHKSFSIKLSDMAKSMAEISNEYTRSKRKDGASEEDINQAEAKAEAKKTMLIEKMNDLYNDFLLLGAEKKELDKIIKDRSAVKATGFDKRTKLGIKGKPFRSDMLFK